MRLTLDELRALWVEAGGPPGWGWLMAGIALAESDGTPTAVQQGQPYSTTGWGLWQITPGNSEPQIGVDDQLLSPLLNAKAAVEKFAAQGATAWLLDRTWTRWNAAGKPPEPSRAEVVGYVLAWATPTVASLLKGSTAMVSTAAAANAAQRDYYETTMTPATENKVLSRQHWWQVTGGPTAGKWRGPEELPT